MRRHLRSPLNQKLALCLAFKHFPETLTLTTDPKKVTCKKCLRKLNQLSMKK